MLINHVTVKVSFDDFNGINCYRVMFLLGKRSTLILKQVLSINKSFHISVMNY